VDLVNLLAPHARIGGARNHIVVDWPAVKLGLVGEARRRKRPAPEGEDQEEGSAEGRGGHGGFEGEDDGEPLIDRRVEERGGRWDDNDLLGQLLDGQRAIIRRLDAVETRQATDRDVPGPRVGQAPQQAPAAAGGGRGARPGPNDQLDLPQIEVTLYPPLQAKIAADKLYNVALAAYHTSIRAVGMVQELRRRAMAADGGGLLAGSQGQLEAMFDQLYRQQGSLFLALTYDAAVADVAACGTNQWIEENRQAIKRAEQVLKVTGAKGGSSAALTCRACGLPGHFASACPRRGGGGGDGARGAPQGRGNFRGSGGGGGGAPPAAAGGSAGQGAGAQPR